MTGPYRSPERPYEVTAVKTFMLKDVLYWSFISMMVGSTAGALICNINDPSDAEMRLLFDYRAGIAAEEAGRAAEAEANRLMRETITNIQDYELCERSFPGYIGVHECQWSDGVNSLPPGVRGCRCYTDEGWSIWTRENRMTMGRE